MWKILTSLLERANIFRPLYSARDVHEILSVVMHGTYDKENVHKAIDEIDRFDAGAVDEALRKHINRVTACLRKLDENEDQKRLGNWKKAL